jgi:aminopeptidase YwaD
MLMKWILVIPALALTGLSPTTAAPLATLPDSTWIMDHVRYLADPICEGRGVGTEGLEHAAEYLEKEFRELGLSPAGEDGTYRQQVEVITGVRVHDPTDITVHGNRYEIDKNFTPLGLSGSGEAFTEVVFAGYGITATEYDWDDYDGIDVTNRFVLVLQYEPAEMEKDSRFEGDVNTAHSEIRTKAINAREHGALGILVVTGPRYHEDDDLIRPRPDAGYMSSGILAAHIRREIADQLLAGSEWTLARIQEYLDLHENPRSFALGDSVRLRVSLEKERAYVGNLIGVLRGRDTTRTLVIGAHYDHLGKTSSRSLAADQGDDYHYGADDNASGVGALLASARAWTSRPEPPIHNLVFAAFAAEELGVIGSGRYVSDPPYPTETTDAMLNFDMVGRLRDRKLILMGTGTGVGLNELVDETAGSFNFDLKKNEGGYGPSDHMSFYKVDVPVLSFFTGAHTDYHRPGDTWDKLNGAGISEIATYGFAISEALDAGPPLEYVAVAGGSPFGNVGGGAGHGAYLGTIPDYSQEEGGVLLSGVREGGPADLAGIQGGDTIISFDGVRVDNIYDFTYALRTRRPQQKVEIGILRDGEKLEVTAILGKRIRSH